MKLLLAEDEPAMSEAVTDILEYHRYQVDAVYDGIEALDYIHSGNYDGIILDWMMPAPDGVEVLRRLRQKGVRTPCLLLTARDAVEDRVQGLDAGADDYLPKPFASAELLARIRVALRHTHNSAGTKANGGCFVAGDLTVDYDKHQVLIGGENMKLTQNEYRIVALLSRYAGKVLTYDYIMKELWGPQNGGGNQILRVNMANIRRKIEKNPAEPQYIFTEVGVGYRMIEGD